MQKRSRYVQTAPVGGSFDFQAGSLSPQKCVLLWAYDSRKI
jgi:hypothetical protein